MHIWYLSLTDHGEKVTSAKPQYSGLQYFTTTISPKNPFYSSADSMAGGGNYGAFGDGKQLTVQKLGDGSYYICFGLRLSESWNSENAALLADPSALRQWMLQEYFVDSPQMHIDLIKHSEGFRPWPLYTMPTKSLSWQTVPGVTLIGDAAHVTYDLLPHKGVPGTD